MSKVSRCGFGSLFISLASITSLFAQQDLPPPSRIRPLPLLGSESVQKEIKLTDDQKAKIAALLESFEEAASQLREDTMGDVDFRTLSDEQRAKWYDGIRKINDHFEPKTKEILKSDQIERAQQIAHQLQEFEGVQAFRNPDVVNALKLTKEQQEMVETVGKDFLKKSIALRADDSRVSAAKVTEFKKLQEDLKAIVAKLLTKEQNEKWMALKGKPFDISTIRPVRQPKTDEKKQ